MVVLNIDDDGDDREMFCDALKAVDSGIACIQMESGIKAIEYFEKNGALPDYIFIDINMPKMNGYECVKAIRAIPKLLTVPVFMHSTMFDPRNEVIYAKLGIKHLQKSSRPSDLIYSLKDLLNLK